MSGPDRLADITRRHKPGVNNDVDYLLNQLTHAQMATERLRGLLARLEWAGNQYAQDHCPVCSVGDPPHDPGCWLAAELRR